MSRQYSRVFISLKQDRAGYGYRGKEPSGRCVIDARDGISKITVYIQDIKPEIIYKAYIISCDHTQAEAVPLGTLSIDAKGKAELRMEFDANNAFGTGKPIERFNAAAVIVPANNELIAPLAGYKDEIVAWKNNFTVYSPDKKTIPAMPEEGLITESLEGLSITEEEIPLQPEVSAVTVPEENLPQEDEPEVIRTEEINTAETAASEAFDIEPWMSVNEEASPVIIAEEEAAEEEATEEVHAEEVHTEEVHTEEVHTEEVHTEEVHTEEVHTEEAVGSESHETETIVDKGAESAQAAANEGTIGIAEAFMEMAMSLNEELRELEQIAFVNTEPMEDINIASAGGTDSGIAQADVFTGSPIDGMFANNTPMRPFQKQNFDISWVRISMREMVYLPLDHWKYMNHPFMISAYNRFKHIILGRYDDGGEMRYFIGVPEIYDVGFKKRAMSLGFTQFKCCQDIRAANGEYGYWILPFQL